LRVLPLSLSLLVAALGIPRLWPHLSPRLAVRLGIALMLIGILLLRSGISIDAAAAVVALPMVFMGLGIGTLASQLGALVVSSVDESLSGDVGGLQNTATNLGSSLGTAVAGSILIAALTSSFLTGITQNQDVPESVKAQANVSLSDGAPFLSDADLTAGLVKAGADPQLQSAILAQNRTSRIAGLHAALGVLSLIAVLALFFTGGIPTRQPGVRPPGEPGPDGDEPDGEVPGDGRPDDEVPGDERPDDERPGDQRAGDRRAADPASGPTGRQSPTASAASSPAP
ncbi:MAG: hypothetical protein L6367_07475, partial [Cellulomonas sp.]|nr:hypothetical protein [Cellulomonas sp.]